MTVAIKSLVTYKKNEALRKMEYFLLRMNYL